MSRQRQNRRRNSDQTVGELRIIGGEWRGRKLKFPAVEGLRPTSDRVRETLFNWLAPTLPGAHCVDLFAGSGALGLEALSRGAALCRFVELNPAAAKQLEANLSLLHAENGDVSLNSADQWLQTARQLFDIIFVDPPFHKGLATSVIESLGQLPLLKPGAQIYLELGRDEPLPPTPANWRLHREKHAGQVSYRLFVVE